MTESLIKINLDCRAADKCASKSTSFMFKLYQNKSSVSKKIKMHKCMKASINEDQSNGVKHMEFKEIIYYDINI